MSQAKFQILFDRSTDPHIIFDATGITDCNDAMIRLLGAPDKSRVLSLHPAALSPEFQPDGRRSAEKSAEMDRIARALGHYRFEWVHRRLDGKEVPSRWPGPPAGFPYRNRPEGLYDGRSTRPGI